MGLHHYHIYTMLNASVCVSGWSSNSVRSASGSASGGKWQEGAISQLIQPVSRACISFNHSYVICRSWAWGDNSPFSIHVMPPFWGSMIWLSTSGCFTAHCHIGALFQQLFRYQSCQSHPGLVWSILLGMRIILMTWQVYRVGCFH